LWRWHFHICYGDDGDGDGGDEEDGHEEAGDESNESVETNTTRVVGSRHSASDGGRMLEDEEEDDVFSNLGRSNILITSPKSDEENEVDSRLRCVTRISKFHDVDMEDPHLVVGMTFTSVNHSDNQWENTIYLEGKMFNSVKMMGIGWLEFVGVRAMIVPGEFMVHCFQVSWLSYLSH
jgi:hypothetical protein